MRVIERLYKYLELRNISPYSFERSCGIANGYLKKQFKGRGTVGSEILEKIIDKYSDLSLIWLITGKGKMLINTKHAAVSDGQELADDEKSYPGYQQIIQLLRDQISILEKANADKEKIIRLLESQIVMKSPVK